MSDAKTIGKLFSPKAGNMLYKSFVAIIIINNHQSKIIVLNYLINSIPWCFNLSILLYSLTLIYYFYLISSSYISDITIKNGYRILRGWTLSPVLTTLEASKSIPL